MKINPQLQSVLDKHFGKELSQMQDKVVIISTYHMKQDEVDAILDKFPHLKNKSVENVVEPDIIGGFVIKFGSKLIDLSLLTQLQSLQQKLYEE